MGWRGAWTRRQAPHVIAAERRQWQRRAAGARKGRRAWDLPPVPARPDQQGEIKETEQERSTVRG
jgi:hypothetical protein